MDVKNDQDFKECLLISTNLLLPIYVLKFKEYRGWTISAI